MDSVKSEYSEKRRGRFRPEWVCTVVVVKWRGYFFIERRGAEDRRFVTGGVGFQKKRQG